MDLPVYLPKFVLVASLIAGAAGAHAQTELVPVAESTEVALTEAQRCEQQLAEVHKEGLNKRLKTIEKDDQFVEMAVQAMKDAGQIQDLLGEQRVRAKLKLGGYFAQLGLLHEAIYQAFKERYQSNAEIADALRSFSQISRANEQGVLISEVIERVLQYIPDVDSSNVNKIKETAAFLGMNQSQLQEFYTKWVELDQEDEYAETLQGGILAILTAGNEKVIQSVQERSGWLKRKLSGWKVIAVPARPKPLNEALTVRQTQVEDRDYFDTEELVEYLRQSSTAARRYFISTRANVMTRQQLIAVIQNEEAWYLKPSLIADLKRQLSWRNALAEKFKIFADLQRAQGEANAARARLENNTVFDQRQVQQAVGKMRQMETAATVLHQAIEILKTTHKDDNGHLVFFVNSLQYVNVVLSITANATKLLGDGPATVELIDRVVTYGNMIGLLPDHANKLQRDLGAVAQRASGRAGDAAARRVRELVPTTPRYEGQTLEQINLILLQLNANLETAREELDQLYAKKF